MSYLTSNANHSCHTYHTCHTYQTYHTFQTYHTYHTNHTCQAYHTYQTCRTSDNYIPYSPYPPCHIYIYILSYIHYTPPTTPHHTTGVGGGPYHTPTTPQRTVPHPTTSQGGEGGRTMADPWSWPGGRGVGTLDHIYRYRYIFYLFIW